MVFWLFTVLFASTGMSFVAGIVGVVIWLRKRLHFSPTDFLFTLV